MFRAEFAASFLLALGLAHALFAQNDKPLTMDDYGRQKLAVVRTGPTHQLQALETHALPSDAEEMQFGWLQSADVSADLDLTDDQAAAIKRCASSLDKFEDCYAEMARVEQKVPRDLEAVRAAGQKLKDARAEIANELTEILLPMQQRRLSQLRERQSLIETGLESAIQTRWVEALDLDDVAKEKLIASLDESRANASAQRLINQRDITKDALRLLTRRQHGALSAEVGEVPSYLAPSTEVLLWQLRQDVDVEQRFDDRLDELFKSRDGLLVALDGKLEAYSLPVGSPYHDIWETCLRSAYGPVEVVNFQKSPTPPLEEYRKRGEELNERLRKLTDRFLDGDAKYAEIRAEMVTGMAEIGRWQTEQWFTKLIPHQRDEVERVLLRRLIAVRGLHACLINGTLGDLLEITPDQRKQIAAVAATRADAIQQAAATTERKIWAELRKTLAELGEAGELDELIGPEPKNLAGSPDLLLRPASPR